MTSPAYTIYDAISTGPGTAVVAIRRLEKSYHSITVQVRAINATAGVYAPQWYDSYQREFVLNWDADEWRIPIRVNALLGVGQTIGVVVEQIRTFGNSNPVWARKAAYVAGLGTTGLILSPDLPTGAVSVLAGTLPRREVPSAYAKTFNSNLIDGFTATDSGFDSTGKPCWKTQLGHGRAQSNGEVGMYTDASLHGTKPLLVEGGVRVLQADKLPVPIRYSGRDWAYSASVITTETLFKMGYGWSEAIITLDPKAVGSWPAFWGKRTPHWSWPPELDHLEICMNGSSNPAPFFTQWHKDANGIGQNHGTKINLAGILGAFDFGKAHSFAVHWTPDYMEWIIDGVMVHSQPTTIKVEAISADPMVDTRLYLKLNVALGGQAGTVGDATLPAKMAVHQVTVYEPKTAVVVPPPVVVPPVVVPPVVVPPVGVVPTVIASWVGSDGVKLSLVRG